MSLPQFTDTAKIKLLEWRMAILWFVLFSVNSLCSCVVAAMAGSVWSSLGTQEKFTMVVAILGNWTGTIMALFSKAAKKVDQELDGATVTRTDTVTQSTQVTQQPPSP